MRSAFLILLTAAALTLTACNRGNTVPEDGGPSMRTGEDGGFSTDQQGDGGGNITETPLEAEQRRLMQQLVVYFEYDEAEILPEFNALLQAHGQFLARNPNFAAQARRPRRRARQPRVQHRPRRAPRAGGAPRADAARRGRHAVHDGQLRRGAPRANRERRRSVAPESARRARVSLSHRSAAGASPPHGVSFREVVAREKTPLAVAAAILASGCSTLSPAEDPTALRMTDIEARLIRMERVVENQSLVELSSELERLRSETTTLRGEIETLRFETENSDSRQRELYVDVDRRLQSLETGRRVRSSRRRRRRPRSARRPRRLRAPRRARQSRRGPRAATSRTTKRLST